MKETFILWMIIAILICSIPFWRHLPDWHLAVVGVLSILIITCIGMYDEYLDVKKRQGRPIERRVPDPLDEDPVAVG